MSVDDGSKFYLNSEGKMVPMIESYEQLQSKHTALLEQVEKLNKDFFLGIIDEWQLNWMNVTGTNEADRSNYYSRAFGVDANMRYSLARMICKALASFEAWKKENLSE